MNVYMHKTFSIGKEGTLPGIIEWSSERTRIGDFVANLGLLLAHWGLSQDL